MTLSSPDRMLLAGIWLISMVMAYVALEWRRERREREVFLDTYCTSVLTRLPTARDTTKFLAIYPECVR